MNSRDYWKKREDEARKNTIRDEREYNKRLNEIYQYMIDNVERQVNSWYANYASKEGITMAEARGRVKHIDMERYERLAAKYVATHDFSDQANEEMALYNLTMKVNRLELLKAEINLELMAGFDDIEHEMRRDLIETAMKEDRRLAGILGDSVIGNERYAAQLVNASFKNATFSERLWGNNMPALRVHLEAELRNGLVQGIGSQELARRFRKHYGGSVKDTERLMATEMCRLQTAVQKESFERNGYKEYMFISSGNDNVCPDCEALHGQHFKVSEMQAGVNAPPMHPRCHCSAAAWSDKEKYNRWIEALANGEDVRWNEFENGDVDDSELDVFKSVINVFSRSKFNDPIEDFEKGLSVVSDSNTKKALEKSYKRTQLVRTNNKKSTYRRNNHTVYLGKKANGSSTAHELFHEIDHHHGYTDNGLLKTSVDADYANLAKAAKSRMLSIEQYLVLKYPEAFQNTEAGNERIKPEYRGLSDIIHGCSGASIDLGYGHRTEGYWDKENALQRETFAQHGRMMYDSIERVIRMYSDLFPTVYKEINDKLSNEG